MKIENAKITWLESGLPYSTEFQDIYYSRDDAIAESQHVFLDANKLRQRWEHDCCIETFHIGELGFGSGLNFLQVMKLWQELDRRPARLHYIAFEKHPLTIEELQRIHQRWPSLANQSTELLEQYMDHSEGCHRIPLANEITLDVYYGDAHEQLNQRMMDACPAIQCWFLDGFSPANNIELWEEPLMHLLARCSDENTTLSSYSVAGKVRSALKNAGFEVSKIEGFGRKRHSLFAAMPVIENGLLETKPKEKRTPSSSDAPWFILPEQRFRGKTAVIIGAGLAGCSTAHSLAKRGWKVTVVDAGPTPASAASGNSQMALRCRLFNAPSPEARFFLHAYLFALRQFTQFRRHGDLAWNPCGVLQLSNAMNKRNPLQLEKLQQLYSKQIVRLLSKAEASSEAGIALCEEAWLFPSGGAMEPSSLCAAYLAHTNISCVFNARVTELNRTDEKWQVDAGQAQAIDADVVVVANSHSATLLSQCTNLPLQSLRGQTSEISANESSNKLKSVVSGGRTVFPANAGRHLLSASYANSTELQALPADTHENIVVAATNFADADILNRDSVVERVSLRCNSPDRMPLVGMAPNLEKMSTTYAELSRNARAKLNSAGEYYAGLYLNVAHGSNGLASCPLSAEFLASLITKENLPLSRDIAASINPTRFLIKDLKKQR
ncbi:MAG: bifunctional tRNA (5-methylaminomethyl-2-thiouridine)(34)-methyltransferase MnmD/FAD-dependent 5-carboxymethylaminomethyl-2-thiouridine(34) oxidoreductase MnmC [SAR86 cluster bacterium]|uniref:tRNA 5-methylaminomethyl-2-thiouridine biosynthesis bifunctional protein MnmC n=1 Tax=SAR86 cluster bacterium TaxID=2030880 RepID=A0A2A4WUJ9_9GAMM|nr:MAG: bifunctional tRNA (5-methylaminomethyl-2-thiouridine)(34)-methyltransferase MnmD/FAD-dependent 5-carboxymethylaminomethyl-2-thiouridine(34) oxidoreductase MnmC [SAR86 cluster bacterium]